MLRLSAGLKNKLMGDGSGGSLRSLMTGGIIRFYAGAQPSSADNAEGATLLAEITLDGGSFTGGASGGSTNGLSFEVSSGGAIVKLASETWSGTGITGGAAGWFRFYDSNGTVGSSTTDVRLDGSIATAGGQITMSNATIETSTPLVVPTFSITLP